MGLENKKKGQPKPEFGEDFSRKSPCLAKDYPQWRFPEALPNECLWVEDRGVRVAGRDVSSFAEAIDLQTFSTGVIQVDFELDHQPEAGSSTDWITLILRAEDDLAKHVTVQLSTAQMKISSQNGAMQTHALKDTVDTPVGQQSLKVDLRDGTLDAWHNDQHVIDGLSHADLASREGNVLLGLHNNLLGTFYVQEMEQYKNNEITVENMPTGFQLRRDSVVVSETNGSATINAGSPDANIELLDEHYNVQNVLQSEDIVPGNTYQVKGTFRPEKVEVPSGGSIAKEPAVAEESLFSDLFDRANETLANGPDWSEASNTGTAAQIVSNEVLVAGDHADNFADGAGEEGEIIVEADVRVDVVEDFLQAGVMARVDRDSSSTLFAFANRGIKAYLTTDGTGGDRVVMASATNGTIASTSFAWTTGVYYSFRLVVRDGRQELYIDGTLVLSASETSADGVVGEVGLISSLGNNDTAEVAYDNFDVRSVAKEAEDEELGFIKTRGLPSGGYARTAGRIAPANSKGVARIDVTNLSLPGSTIEVLDYEGNAIASLSPADGTNNGEVFTFTSQVRTLKLL